MRDRCLMGAGVAAVTGGKPDTGALIGVGGMDVLNGAVTGRPLGPAPSGMASRRRLAAFVSVPLPRFLVGCGQNRIARGSV